MTPQTELEIKGSFFAHPFAELLAEVAHARLNGSLRLADGDKKCVVYFKAGRVVYAVSNARSARLFAILLKRERLSKDDLAKIPNFANDLDFAAYLQDKNVLSKAECDRLFTEQIEAILVDTLAWTNGEWTFSSLARIRDGLAFEVNTPSLLVDYGRCMAVGQMLGRFRSLEETFSRSAVAEFAFGLKPEEAFILSRADAGDLSAADMISVAAMTEAAALHAIYTLWLGGLLTRNGWQPAFSPDAVRLMKSAKLELKREAKFNVATETQESILSAPEPPKPVDPTPPKPPETAITLEEYLERVEHAETHYDILGVNLKADADELKRAYFGLARQFHPDRYHAEGGETLKRIQNAFTELAQAHETLKTPESREVYDYRMRKELADRARREAEGNTGDDALKVDQAREHFERGFSLLMDDEAETALPFLARAVHYDPKNARYHAYYGKALSADSTHRHKAESEMQAALKIDPNNATYRILLAEFFIQNNLKKRAEGELNRLLAVFPSNREAQDLLAALR